MKTLPMINNISKPKFNLASREHQGEDTIINVKGVKIGGDHMTIIAGPCAIENEYQMITTAKAVKAAGATMLRGGAYKPRTSPYSFQGLEEEGLKLLKQAGDITNLPTVSEVISTETFDIVEAYVDILQIGTRNMQNFPLLKRAGQSKKPILLKRGMAATIEELLMAAEYIMSEGNHQVILCERGIRTFETYTRNTLDLSAVLAVRKLSHLPIIVDPSHATGQHDMIEPLSKASIITGAHGLMIEVHYQPEIALCDGPQSLKTDDFHHLMRELFFLHDHHLQLKRQIRD
ncbi:MAG: 3-deoxy-7-phosphoheptulonate synthase [Clostridia bacterium]|nr:3-deoxy-7-phosphoheptulonate synthase [Clostridia bacterium]